MTATIEALAAPAFRTDHLIAEPEDQYHAKREHFLTSHAFINFVRSPAYYRKLKDGVFTESIPQDAATFGSAFHMALLEPDRYEDVFAVEDPPVNPSTGKPYGTGTKKHEDWVAQVGGNVLTPEQDQLVMFLRDAAMDQPGVQDLLETGMAEGVVRPQWCGVDIQARFDWISHAHGLVDVKTTKDVDGFARDAQKYDYHIQQAFYWCAYLIASGLSLCENNANDIHLIVVEKQPPYRVVLRKYEATTVWLLMQHVMHHMAEFSACEQTGVWPARSSGIPELNPTF